MIPLTFGPLRAAAERAAREHYEALLAVGAWSTPWDHLLSTRPWVEAQASLLADLSRPASMDFWSRYLAERVGIACGATAPGWSRVEPGIGWIVVGTAGSWLFTDHPAHSAGERRTVIAGASSLTDPAAALCAAVLAIKE